MRLFVTIASETCTVELRHGFALARVESPDGARVKTFTVVAGEYGEVAVARLDSGARSLERNAPGTSDSPTAGTAARGLRHFSRTGSTVRIALDDGRVIEAEVESERERIRTSALRSAGDACRSSELRSAIPGVVRRVLCRVGDRIAAGAALLTLEAMKMESELRAERGGLIREIRCAEGDTVAADTVLLTIEPLRSDSEDGAGAQSS